MDTILIKNGTVIDPSRKLSRRLDILITGGKIAEINPTVTKDADHVIDARQRVVCAGFIDLHTHLREPGGEATETIATGTRAAAAGGFTTVCTMPNTNPVADSQTAVKFVMDRAKTTGVVNVLPVAAITKGLRGEEIVEFGDLVSSGAVAFSDDGNSVMNSEIMRRALEYTSMFQVPVMSHCEDKNLSEAGYIYEGDTSAFVGLRGIPATAESVMVARDIELADFTGGRLHLCHISTRQSVDMIAKAKRNNIKVTAEVTPHHLLLTDRATEHFDTNTKVKPPLSSERDRRVLVDALRKGIIDVIATDHAPHSVIDKDKVFTEAPFGLIGLETAFAVIYTKLGKKRALTLNRLIKALTSAPANILGLKKGSIRKGWDADLTIIDLDRKWVVDQGKFFSKSANCPFNGAELTGKVVMTIVGGKIVFDEANPV